MLQPGSIQIEACAQIVSDRVGVDSFATTTTTLSIPFAVLRIGVLERMEIDAAAILQRNVLVYGVGGVIAPFIGIKIIDPIINLI